MTNQDQLTLVANAFAQWRQTRPHRSTAIPDSLRQQAVALQTHYTKGKIIKTLRLSGSQLTAWTQQTKPDDHHTDFIPSYPQLPLLQKSRLTLSFRFVTVASYVSPVTSHPHCSRLWLRALSHDLAHH